MEISLKKTTAEWMAIVQRLADYFAAKGYTDLNNMHLFRQASCQELVALEIARMLHSRLAQNQYSPRPKDSLKVTFSIAQAIALITLNYEDSGVYESSALRQLTREVDAKIVNLPAQPACQIIPLATPPDRLLNAPKSNTLLR